MARCHLTALSGRHPHFSSNGRITLEMAAGALQPEGEPRARYGADSLAIECPALEIDPTWRTAADEAQLTGGEQEEMRRLKVSSGGRNYPHTFPDEACKQYKTDARNMGTI